MGSEFWLKRDQKLLSRSVWKSGGTIFGNQWKTDSPALTEKAPLPSDHRADSRLLFVNRFFKFL